MAGDVPIIHWYYQGLNQSKRAQEKNKVAAQIDTGWILLAGMKVSKENEEKREEGLALEDQVEFRRISAPVFKPKLKTQNQRPVTCGVWSTFR